MKAILFTLLASFYLVGCDAQTREKAGTTDAPASEEKIEPKVDYKVNKEYDEHGNLIKLDSTYTYYYSNIDKNEMLNDSVFKRFTEHFKSNRTFNHSLFDDMFDADDFGNDFFTEDFFRGDFDRNRRTMQNMMRRMDSLKNSFFLEQFPLEKQEKDTIDN